MNRGITITGTKAVLDKLSAFGKEAEDIISVITEVKARELQTNATMKVPVDQGQLKQSIIATQNDFTHWKVSVNAYYGAFIEFGTGKQVQVPSEWQSFALQFKGSKGRTFHDFLKAIIEWAARKGITTDESQAWLIAMSILKKGIRPQPFLYPAFTQAKLTYQKDLETALKALKSKYG